MKKNCVICFTKMYVESTYCHLDVILTSNSVFRENRCPSSVNFQFFYSVTLKLGQGHKNLISSLLCPKYISMNIW